MSNIACKNVNDFINKHHLFPFLETNEGEASIDDFMYADFYLTKKYSLEYGFDLKRIKDYSTKTYEEYNKCVNEELGKIPNNEVFKKNIPLWSDFYKKPFVFDFINNLDLTDFDINIHTYGWLEDSFLSRYIDYSNTNQVLSVFTTFYDEKLSKQCNVDVIYHQFQEGNMWEHKLRFDVVDLHNYSFSKDKFPKDIEKEYDLVVLDLCNSHIDSLDKTFSAEWDDELENGFYNGDNVQYNISNITNYLTENGIGIIKVPFTHIAHLKQELIDKNIIDSIIYLPKEKEGFANNYIYVKDVYIVVKQNKANKNIIFFDRKSGEKISVSNDLIKRHKGYTNIHLYDKHNPKLEKLYRIKEDNEKQLNIINEETKIIDKEIDEWDL